MNLVMRRPRPAFSLVEMLVVLGVVAVLLSLLLPALGRARQQARVIQCSAALRTIGQACLHHAIGTRGYLPLAGRVTASPAADPSNYPAALNDPARRRYRYAEIPGGAVNASVVPFVAALAPDLGVDNLPDRDWNALDVALNARNGPWRYFVCPATNSMEKGNIAPTDANVVDQGAMMICMIGAGVVTGWATNSDYAANEGVFGYHYDPRHASTRLGGRLAAVRRSAELVLFTDAVPRKEPADPSFALGWLTWTPRLDAVGPVTLGDALAGNGRAESPQNFDRVRHGRRLNAVFADGHTETLAIEKGALGQAYLIEP